MSVTTISTTLVFATIAQAREFPVHVKFEDWDYDQTDVEAYIKDLLVQSGGAGVGIGLVLSIVMFLSILMFWCCPCCCFDTCCLCCRKDKEHSWSEKANKKFGAFMLVFSLLLCGAGVGLLYPTTVETLDNTDNAMSNAASSMVDSMNYICGDPLTSYLVENGASSYDSYKVGKTAQDMCTTSSSLSAYLTDTACKLNSTLESVESFIDGLSDIVSGLDNITNAISGLENSLNSLENGANSVNTVCGPDLDTSFITLSNYAQSKMGNTVPVFPATITAPGFAIPPDIMSDIMDAQTNVATAKSDATTSANDARTTIENDLQITTKNELITARNDATETLDDAQHDLIKNMPDIAERRENVKEAQTDYYQEYKDYILIGFLVFYGLGFLFVLISLCGFLRMSTCIVQCGGCMIFLVTFWLCAFMGLTMLFWMITGDVCDNIWEGNEKSGNRGLFQVNLANETIDIQNITINVAEKVEAILKCKSGCEDIPSNCNDLPSMADTNSGCDETNNLLDILEVQEEFNFTSEIQPSIDDILAYAPDLNYNTEIQSARDGLNTSAVNNALTYDFNFNMSEVESVAPQLLASFPQCEQSCNDTKVSGESSLWQAVWLVSSSNVNCAYLTTPSNFDNSDSYYSANCILINLVNNVDTSVDNCTNYSNNITVAQQGISNAVDTVDGALSQANTTVLTKQDELLQQADQLGVLIAYIPEEAPGHLTCDWISEAWTTTVEKDVCTHAYESMQNALPGMGLCIAGMVIAFFAMMDCANPHRIQIGTGAKEDGFTHSSNWDHPLAHPDGAIDENGRVRIPDEQPKKYWNRNSTVEATPVKGVDGPMYPDSNTTATSPMATARKAAPTAEVVAISSSSSNLYGL